MHKKMEFVLLLFLLISANTCLEASKELKCAVCKVVVQRLEKDISKVNPNKKINLGHRLNGQGAVEDKTGFVIHYLHNKFKAWHFNNIFGSAHALELSLTKRILWKTLPKIFNTKPYARSEIHLSELMDSVCEKMEDYVRGINKATGKLEVIPIIMDSGGMNPRFTDYDLVQDSDLNKSLKFYCEGIVEEFETEFLAILGREVKDPESEICYEATNLCSAADVPKNEL